MSDAVLDAYLAVIARDGWGAARIDAVAEVAGMTTSAVAAAFPDRWAMLRAYGLRLDRTALAIAASDSGQSVRDRLFALLMERFDAALPDRNAVRVLAVAARRDPGLAGFFAATVPQSVARLADAAGVETGGLLGPFRVQALSILLLDVSRVWLDDDSDDLATTMKALDDRLMRAERLARLMPHRAASLAPEPMADLTSTPDLTPILAAPRSVDDPLPG